MDGEELLCEQESHDDHDRYSVAVKKKGGIHNSCQLWPLHSRMRWQLADSGHFGSRSPVLGLK